MIIQETKNTVVKSDNLVEKNFTIKSCSKAFKILSDKLYSDKIGAVIRELSTNAYDSHVEAKNPNPFDVHFPNMIEPYFYIRDYGTGISPENIISVYCDFFNSTRSESNEMVGMLGLGSKSPFCYTDKFSVTSWYNGKKYIYSAYINETGVPSITKMAECDSDQPNGLEVKFPVNTNDFREFASKIEKIYPYFKIKPNIMGANTQGLSQFIPEVKYILKGNGWGVRGENTGHYRRYGSSGCCNAIMGNISYPISANNLGTLTDIESNFLYTPVDIYFDIGEVDIAASREQLSYDDTSIKNIKNKIKVIREDMITVLGFSLSAAKTLWDARVIMSKWRHNMHLVRCDLEKIEWNGKKVCEENDVYNLSYVKFINKKEFKISCYRKSRKTERLSATDMLFIGEIDKDVKILHIETSEEIKCLNHRLKKLRETFSGEIYVIECLTSDLSKFKEISGFDSSQNFVAVRDLPYDKIIRTYTKNNGPISVDERNYSKILEWDYEVNDWVKTDTTLSCGGIYLPISRYKIMDATRDSNSNYMELRKTWLESCFNEKVKVYGIKEKYLSEIKNNPKWVNLNNYFSNKVYNALIKNKDVLEGKYYSNAIDQINSSYSRTKYSYTVFSISILCNNLLDNEMINKVIIFKKHAHLFQHIEMNKLYELLNISQVDIDLSKYNKEVKDYVKKFIEQYPMVKVIDSYSLDDSHKKILSDYLKSCSAISDSDSEKKMEKKEEVEVVS